MIPFLPRQIATKAIFIYLGVLAIISVVLLKYALPIMYIVMGIVWVVGFFLLSSYCSQRWQKIPKWKFLRNIIWTALGLRIAWAIFSYFFYLSQTGMPFEFEAADSIGYFEDAAWLSTEKWETVKDYLFTSRNTVSDSGYVLYLTYLYKLIGPYILPTRIIKALWSAATVLLVYLLTRRTFDEKTGRMAAIFACFMPNLIIYCGLHLKETEMIFLLVAFIERSDYLLRRRKFNVWNIAIPTLLGISLFSFRTVLGAAAIFSLATALLFMNSNTLGTWKKVAIISWWLLAVTALAGGSISTEIQSTWEERGSNIIAKRDFQTAKGIKWAKYATGTVMVPMMFFLPFPTMIDVEQQYNQYVLSGGNYVRNVFGGFVLLSLFSAIFIKKNWRNLTLIGTFAITYLSIIAISGFSNSERFLLPGLPFLLILAAYGITQLNETNYKFIKIWFWIVPVMAFGWAFFKLGSRGLF